MKCWFYWMIEGGQRSRGRQPLQALCWGSTVNQIDTAISCPESFLKYFIRMCNIWFWNKKKIAHWQRSIQRVSQQRKVSQQTSATGQTVNLRPQQSRKVCVNYRLWTRWIWYHSTKRKMGQKWLLFNQNFHCSHLEFNVGTIWK